MGGVGETCRSYSYPSLSATTNIPTSSLCDLTHAGMEGGGFKPCGPEVSSLLWSQKRLRSSLYRAQDDFG